MAKNYCLLLMSLGLLAACADGGDEKKAGGDSRTALESGITLTPEASELTLIEGEPKSLSIFSNKASPIPIELEWFIENGAEDFETSSGKVSVAEGDSSLAIELTAKVDAAVEGQEEFKLVFRTPDALLANEVQVLLRVSEASAPAPDALVLSQAPIGFSRLTQIQIQTSGTNVAQYKYKIGLATSTACTVSDGYSDAQTIGAPIVADLTTVADGPIRVCAIASNGSGVWQAPTEAIVAQWVKDTTAPSLPSSVDDGTTFINPRNILVSWGGSTDATSGLSFYEIAVGRTAGASDVLSWKNVGFATSATLDLSVVDGDFFTSVRATDKAGNVSAARLGDGWRLLHQFTSSQRLALDEIPNTPFRYGREQAMFGKSVALSDDGQWLVVGAPADPWSNSPLQYLSKAGSAFVFQKSVSGWSLVNKLTLDSAARAASDGFGSAVAFGDGQIFIGSPGKASGAGRVFVYQISPAGWQLEQTLQPSGTKASMGSDGFGSALAYSDGSLIVGAPGQDFDEAGAGQKSGAGAAYVFNLSAGVWRQQQKIIAQGPNGRNTKDAFGSSVAIDGDVIVVGASAHDYDSAGGNLLNASGAAFVYTRNSNVWTMQKKLVGFGVNGRMASDSFGSSVAVLGTTIAVGAVGQSYNENGAAKVSKAGAVYTFELRAGAWVDVQKIVASGTKGRVSSDAFGAAIALHANRLAIGAPNQDTDALGGNAVSNAGAVFVFEKQISGLWSQRQKLVAMGTSARVAGDAFGGGLDMNGDLIFSGAHMQDFDASGASFVENAGAGFLFSAVSSVWSQQAKIVDSSGLSGERMGWARAGFSSAVQPTSDKQWLAVGAPQDAFDSLNDTYLPNAGAVWIYRKLASGWAFDQKIVPPTRKAAMQFGCSLASTDLYIFVGACGEDSSAGAVYVYKLTANRWTFTQRLIATGTKARASGDLFGFQTAASGSSLAVGAYGHDFDEAGANSVSAAGAVYIFSLSSNQWQQTQKIIPSGTLARIANDNFGKYLSMEGNVLAVGSPGQDTNELGLENKSAAGAVFVYSMQAGRWLQTQKLIAQGTNARLASDSFGSAVSVSGDRIAIGSPRHDYDAAGAARLSDAGAAFVFKRGTSSWSLESKIVASGLNSRLTGNLFGWNISLNGESLAVSAPMQAFDSDGINSVAGAGAIFSYSIYRGAWQQSQKLSATGLFSRQARDQLGLSLAVTDNEVFAGAPLQDYDSRGGRVSLDSGALFIWTK